MYLLSGTPLQWRIHPNSKGAQANLLPYVVADFPVGACSNNYEGLDRLNLSTLYSRRRHLGALFLINTFESKINCSTTFDSVSVRIHIRIIGDYSTFMVSHNFKVSHSPRFVSATNAICKDITFLTRLYFAYGPFITLLIIVLSFNSSLSMLCRFHILRTFY
jgi:hypothetical protein